MNQIGKNPLFIVEKSWKSMWKWCGRLVHKKIGTRYTQLCGYLNQSCSQALNLEKSRIFDLGLWTYSQLFIKLSPTCAQLVDKIDSIHKIRGSCVQRAEIERSGNGEQDLQKAADDTNEQQKDPA